MGVGVDDDGVGARKMGAVGGAAGGATGGATGCTGGRGGIGGVSREGAPLGAIPPESFPPGTAAADALAGVTDTGNVPPAIAMIPPHTEHRARTPVAGTLAGSTRKTDWHSGHVTFTRRLQTYVPTHGQGVHVLSIHRPWSARLRRADDPLPRPNPEVSLHNSSFPSPAR